MKPLPKVEVNNPWLKDLSEHGREQVEKELARQRRALKSVIEEHMPQRTARRIIQRSQRRVNYIIADELVKGAKA
jgi:phosphodiesterase/alkaline phosphatase D-like protein